MSFGSRATIRRPVRTMGTPNLPSLADVIAHVESASGAALMRFEPSAYDRDFDTALKLRVARGNACSMDTARMILATSWGRFQFMGATLYSGPVNYGLSVATFLGDPSDQRDAFGLFVAKRGGWDANAPASFLLVPGKAEQFARCYNGPAAIDAYAGRLRQACKELGIRAVP